MEYKKALDEQVKAKEKEKKEKQEQERRERELMEEELTKERELEKEIAASMRKKLEEILKSQQKVNISQRTTRATEGVALNDTGNEKKDRSEDEELKEPAPSQQSFPWEEK